MQKWGDWGGYTIAIGSGFSLASGSYPSLELVMVFPKNMTQLLSQFSSFGIRQKELGFGGDGLEQNFGLLLKEILIMIELQLGQGIAKGNQFSLIIL
jgi:hypothetical protein